VKVLLPTLEMGSGFVPTSPMCVGARSKSKTCRENMSYELHILEVL